MKIFALWAVLLAAPFTSDDVQRLLEQLDAPKLAEREAAERSLQAAGPRVLDMLPGDVASLSPEAKLRIARVKNVLEQQMAVDWIKPTRVTLKSARLLIGQLLKNVEQQTGNGVATNKKSDKTPIDCRKLDHHTFWEVVLGAAKQGGMKIVTRAGDRNVELVPRGKEATQAKLKPIGPFLLVIHERSEFQQELEIAWEPRLEPIWLKLRLDGANGTSAGTYELNPTADAISAELTVPVPDSSAETGLVGKITALVPGPKRSFRFPLADQDARRQRFAQVDLELLDVRQEKDELRLTLRLRYAQTYEALESYRGWFFSNRALLVPAKAGKESKEGPAPKSLEPAATQTDNRTANSIDLIYRFKIDGSADDYTFIYRTPIALLRVDYDFTDK